MQKNQQPLFDYKKNKQTFTNKKFWVVHTPNGGGGCWV